MLVGEQGLSEDSVSSTKEALPVNFRKSKAEYSFDEGVNDPEEPKAFGDVCLCHGVPIRSLINWRFEWYLDCKCRPLTSAGMSH